MFRQWHRRFVTALDQVERAHEEIAQQLVKETDFGEELGKVVENLRITCGEAFNRGCRRRRERFVEENGERSQ